VKTVSNLAKKPRPGKVPKTPPKKPESRPRGRPKIEKETENGSIPEKPRKRRDGRGVFGVSRAPEKNAAKRAAKVPDLMTVGRFP
jgi:hypothetical protein